MLRIDVAERRARLAERHRLAPGRRAGDVVEAARSMVCLHGTDPATVYLSAWARVDGMTVADLDRALYVDRSLVKHLAMRRTLFVFPRETLAVAQAGASNRVADVERRRLIRDVERAGLHRGRRALAVRGFRAGARGPRRRPGSDVVGAPQGDSAARGLDLLRRGEVLGREDVGRPSRPDHAVGGGTHRAGLERRRVDDLPAALGRHELVAGRGDRASCGGSRRGGAGRALAAHVRARHGGRHQVVAGIDPRGRAAGSWRTSRPSRSSSTGRSAICCPTTWSRPSPSSRGPLSCRRSTRPRWAGSSGTGTSAPTGATLRHERQRRADRVVGRADRRRLAPERRRRGRPAAARGRRLRRPGARWRARPRA